MVGEGDIGGTLLGLLSFGIADTCEYGWKSCWKARLLKKCGTSGGKMMGLC